MNKPFDQQPLRFGDLDPNPTRSFRSEAKGVIVAPIEAAFALLDNHARLSDHMSERSWMMGGGKMKVSLDEQKGQAVGSRIGLSGRVFGISLYVEEEVTERVPPFRKAWQTVGTPRLVVIGDYRMGFELEACSGGSLVRVFIEYSRPRGWLGRMLRALFGGYYARWCTERMVADAVSQFRVVPAVANAGGSH